MENAAGCVPAFVDGKYSLYSWAEGCAELLEPIWREAVLIAGKYSKIGGLSSAQQGTKPL
jgi:hypothetical protein